MAVTFIKATNHSLGACFPTAQELPFTPDPATRGILVYVACTSGQLLFSLGMEYGSGNFMDFQLAGTLPGDTHIEAWTLTFAGPANPTTIKILADISPGLVDAVAIIIEFGGNEPDRNLLVGVTNVINSASDSGMALAWVPEHDQSIILDAFHLKGKAGTKKGAGQEKTHKQILIFGKTHGSYEPASGSGPATWTINAAGGTEQRRFSYILCEIRPEVVTQNGSMSSRTEPATFTGEGDVEHDGTFDPPIGSPADFDATGEIERNGGMSRRTEPATFAGAGHVERTGAMDRRTEPAQFFGSGNNNLDHYGGMRTRTEPATFTGEGDVEHGGTFDNLASPNVATFTGIGDTDKSGTMSARADPATFTGEGDVEHSGAMDRRTDPAVLAGDGDVEHSGAMDKRTEPAILVGSGSVGSDTPGFDVASRNFVITIDSTYNAIRAQIRHVGATAAIQIPVDGHSIIIRKLT